MMELPLYMNDFFGHYTGLVFGAFLGFAFGFVLERSGFGRATVLAAQFYFTDMRVLKVMFTSIVTALLGLTILSGVGVLDIHAISIPHTYLWPQLFGGLLLGVGFIVSGYCPGTGVVAMASGKLDGLATIFGVMLGSILFGFGFPLYEGFYHSGDLGVFRFSDLLGIPDAFLAVAVTLMAIGMFIGGEKLEQIFTRGHGPDRAPMLRRRIFAGLSAVAVVGLATLLVTQPEPAQSERRIGTITPVELAQMAIEDPAGFYLVDLRTLGEDAERIPGALAVTEDDTDAAFVADLPTTRTLVVYGDTGTELPASVYSFEGNVVVLAGGYDAFASQILTAPVLGDNPTPDEIQDFKLRSALHAHFTGSALQDAPPPPRPKKQIKRAGKKEGGC
jgi:rhodanese-related sulfurtransferase